MVEYIHGRNRTRASENMSWDVFAAVCYNQERQLMLSWVNDKAKQIMKTPAPALPPPQQNQQTAGDGSRDGPRGEVDGTEQARTEEPLSDKFDGRGAVTIHSAPSSRLHGWRRVLLLA